jgi:hypothetical protein
LAHHVAQHQVLLVVLLAEDRRMRHDHVEQLQHHRGDAAEVPRAERAVEDVLQIGGLDHVGLRLGVDLLFVRREHHVYAGVPEFVAVGLKGARIALEIFLRRELQAVDENAHHRTRGLGFGDAYQFDMPLVQVAHGGHEDVVGLAL